MLAGFRWVSVIFSSIYDDILLSTYLTTREFLSQHLTISQYELYYSATIYSIGFLIGGLFWNILSKKYSVKKLLFLSQFMVLVSTLGFFICTSAIQIFVIRFLQGVFANGAFICINILVKHNFKQNDFNRYLALNTLFAYVAEAIMPLISGVLNQTFDFRASIAFLSFIILISMYTIRLDFKDIENKQSFRSATKYTLTSYWYLMKSELCLLLIIAGIAEGVIDLLFNLLGGMISNVSAGSSNQLLTVSLSIISVCSSILVNLISYLMPDKEDNSENGNGKFNWSIFRRGSNDKAILYFTVEVVVIVLTTSCVLQFSGHYVGLITYTVCIAGGLCIVNYIVAKTLYSVYYSSGCIASSLSFFETLISAVIQGISLFATRLEDNRYIYLYCLLYVGIIFLLARIFYRLVGSRYRSVCDSN
jgi:MFS family permease